MRMTRVVVVLALVAAACGVDTNSTDPTAGSSSASTAAPTTPRL